MALNRRHFHAPPEAVWAVLSDGYTYADWVVGTSAIRGVDTGFPGVGCRIHYTVGHGPVRHEGHTRVERCEPGRELELEAHAWPLGTARIVLTVDPAGGGGSTVTIVEHPQRGLGRWLHSPLSDLALKLRNVVTLRRLHRLVAQRAAEPVQA